MAKNEAVIKDSSAAPQPAVLQGTLHAGLPRPHMNELPLNRPIQAPAATALSQMRIADMA